MTGHHTTPTDDRPVPATAAEWRVYRAEREADALRAADRERLAHPRLWREWERVRPLLTARSFFEAGEWYEYDFAAFRAEVGRPPAGGGRVGRRDRTRGYEPGNLRWRRRRATAATPAVPADAVYLTAKEAAAYLRLKYGSFRNIARRIPRTTHGRYARAALDRYATEGPLRRKRKPVNGT